jgi:hypothetical protein
MRRLRFRPLDSMIHRWDAICRFHFHVPVELCGLVCIDFELAKI